ncbi:MAG: hypothetical protein C3F11_01785 [Methylocystaceae bacterium]|nr:MAG: hypothetical protein C3F11_01785 [Methylocystaceae bacterium]
MRRDLDLLRDLLLGLERAQRSPPEPIFVTLGDVARMFGRLPSEIEAHLDLLVRLDFIEGPGAYKDGLWLFRKLTKRGCWLVDNIRDARRWGEIKGTYAWVTNR